VVENLVYENRKTLRYYAPQSYYSQFRNAVGSLFKTKYLLCQLSFSKKVPTTNKEKPIFYCLPQVSLKNRVSSIRTPMY